MEQKSESKVKTPSQPAPVAATPQQAGDTRKPWWWVERSVWTERMLTRLTTSEPANRVWFRLWDKTYAPANLVNGSFTGNFIHPVTHLPTAIRGVFLQDDVTAIGFFLGPSRSGAVVVVEPPVASTASRE